jgi:hypothetical protein
MQQGRFSLRQFRGRAMIPGAAKTRIHAFRATMADIVGGVWWK